MRKSLTPEHFNTVALRLKAGDKTAGKELFEYWSPLLFRFFMLRIAHKGKAEDLVQDVFLKLISRIDTFDTSVGNFTAWFWQVAKNTLKDYYREKKEGTFSDVFPDGIDIADDRPVLETSLRVQEVLRVLSRFSEEEQETFSLRCVSGLSYKEIAAITARSEGALRVEVHRLTQKLKKLLHE